MSLLISELNFCSWQFLKYVAYAELFEVTLLVISYQSGRGKILVPKTLTKKYQQRLVQVLIKHLIKDFFVKIAAFSLWSFFIVIHLLAEKTLVDETLF